MAKTEEGDFELLIGNKQLLTVFFVVVILLGVFFTMGYIVGKNSVVASDPVKKDKPVVLEPPSSSPQMVQEKQPPPPEPSPKEPEPAKEAPKPETKEVAKADPPASKTAPVAAKEPVSLAGTYLQIAAPDKRPAAEAMADAARKKGFSSAVIEIPGNVVRYGILIGPIANGEIGKTRADLEAAGLNGNKGFVKKF